MNGQGNGYPMLLDYTETMPNKVIKPILTSDDEIVRFRSSKTFGRLITGSVNVKTYHVFFQYN